MADSARLTKCIKDAGISFRQNSKSYIFTCPLCNGADKLYIRKSDGKFSCWRCRETIGFQGAPEYALSELTGKSILDIKKALYGDHVAKASVFLDIKFNDLVDLDELPELIQESDDLPSLTIPYHCLPIDHLGARKGLEYLSQKRGIPVSIAKQYDIRYSPERKAIMFPAYVNDHVVGWQYRTIENIKEVLEDNSVVTRLKTMSSKDIPKDRILLFQNNLIEAQEAVLCEGPIDAIKAGRRGVAALGKAVSSKQAAILIMSGINKLYVALDPDAFMELNPLLSKFRDSIEIFKVDVPHVGDKPDLGALSFDAAQECIKKAQPLLKNRLYIWVKPLQHHAGVLSVGSSGD
jgi:hypothetical protein